MRYQMTEIDTSLLRQLPTGKAADANQPEHTVSLWHRIVSCTERATKKAAAGFSDWREHRKTVLALSALDDRMLEDIGLARSEIGAFGVGYDIHRWREIDRRR